MKLFCAMWLALILWMPLADAELALQPVTTGLARPILVTHAPGDATRLFVAEQGGRILILRDGVLNPQPFLDISAGILCCGERGLLGLAFHPDYASNGQFFVNYTRQPAGETVISRFSVTANPDVADPLSEVELLSYAQPFSNHNGGMLAFGPLDGYLYISSGDGGSGNDPHENGQALDTLLGKVLRIDVNEGGEGAGTGGPAYDIPPNNPFVGVAGAREEIWAYGLRNPWRMSFDRSTGDLWIGDVGQNAREELNFQPGSSGGGENYGWRVFEGTLCNTPTVTQPECDLLSAQVIFPIHEYPNPGDGQAITAGHVYRGTTIPSLQGTFFFADYARARIWSLRYPHQVITDFQERTSALDPEDLLSGLASFGEDAQGELYLASLSGAIYKFVDDEAAPCDGALEGGCPDLEALGAAAYAAWMLDWESADVDGSGIADRWELALFERVLCTTVHPLREETICAYKTNLLVLETEPDAAALAPHAEVYAALLSLSQAMQDALRLSLGLTGNYLVAGAGNEPLGAAGDPDGDFFENAQEAANVAGAGGNAGEFAAAALNPLLNGSQPLNALPLGAWPMGAVIALVALAAWGLRRSWLRSRRA